MSATIDTSLFSRYFNDCPVVEIPGRAFPVKHYFIEDCIELTRFVPPTEGRKRKSGGKDGDEEPLGGEEGDENLNKVKLFLNGTPSLFIAMFFSLLGDVRILQRTN